MKHLGKKGAAFIYRRECKGWLVMKAIENRQNAENNYSFSFI